MRARQRLQVLVARLDDAELAYPLGDEWTVAAVLAHLAFWDRRAAILLARASGKTTRATASTRT
jgi:hypothetical protein